MSKFPQGSVILQGSEIILTVGAVVAPTRFAESGYLILKQILKAIDT